MATVDELGCELWAEEALGQEYQYGFKALLHPFLHRFLQKFAANYLFGTKIPTLREIKKAYNVVKPYYRIKFNDRILFMNDTVWREDVYIFTLTPCGRGEDRYCIAFTVKANQIIRIQYQKRYCPIFERQRWIW
jgi:hypothetical protein